MAKIGRVKPENQRIKLGRPFSGKAPSKKDLLRMYSLEGKSIRDISGALNCSKDMVARALKAHGLPRYTLTWQTDTSRPS
jgi:hypothetical protein